MIQKRVQMGVLLAVWAAMIMACAGGSPPHSVAVSGDTASFTLTLTGAPPFMSTLDSDAFSIAQKVYTAAKAHLKAKKVVVKLMMSKNGVQDKYGKAWEEDQEMGEIVITNLDEVRKYVDADNYAISDSVKAQYIRQIKQLKHSNLLISK